MKEKYIVIDTETCNSLDDALVYDIGGCVIDNTGKVYETFSFVIAETYVGKKLFVNCAKSTMLRRLWRIT